MSQRLTDHVAVDLGASSGRVLAGRHQKGSLHFQEIHRFPNGPVEHGATAHWDVARLWTEICQGLTLAENNIGSIGVDAWGVDYALLGKSGELLQNPYHYRNPRNVSAMRDVLEVLSREEIYGQTGIQFMPINKFRFDIIKIK